MKKHRDNTKGRINAKIAATTDLSLKTEEAIPAILTAAGAIIKITEMTTAPGMMITIPGEEEEEGMTTDPGDTTTAVEEGIIPAGEITGMPQLPPAMIAGTTATTARASPLPPRPRTEVTPASPSTSPRPETGLGPEIARLPVEEMTAGAGRRVEMIMGTGEAPDQCQITVEGAAAMTATTPGRPEETDIKLSTCTPWNMKRVVPEGYLFFIRLAELCDW